MMLQTPELVKACLKNNRAAQKQLYDAYAPQMLGVCYRYARRTEDAHDMLQEGFIKVFTNLAKWKNEGELGAWIRRIMVNTALNWLRKEQKWKWEQEDSMAALPDNHFDQLPIERLEQKELVEMIRQLPTGYQTIFNLHAVDGYSHVEISNLLQISEGTSRSQYLRARKYLANQLIQQAQTIA